MDLGDLRQGYGAGTLDEAEMAATPALQFERWFAAARAAEPIDPHAMTLATATRDGIPSARVVLLKGVDESGFVFYTNYDSQKGRELSANPRAALCFHWRALERQVRISGDVERVSTDESLRYFQSRPLASRLSAWASQQSEALADRAQLEARVAEMAQRFADGNVPLPPFWGGFRVRPSSVEFWQGRPDRLHDRLRYIVEPGAKTGWRLERLAP
jgi:pyridoxamine 5'-phosphate oxidase